MQLAQAEISTRQRLGLILQGWRREGKAELAEWHAEAEQECHPNFRNKRYVLFVEHDSLVVDANGEALTDPVKGLIVSAPNIRVARRKLVEETPFHIRRFLHWKECPLYPTDGEAA